MTGLPEFMLGGGTQVGLGLAFMVAAALVVLAGMRLSLYGDALAERTGLGASVVGLLFLAGITSLPELVVSSTSTISASLQAAALPLGAARDALLRAGADLALGNMLGSNVFNLMLVAVMDSVHREGALLARLSQRHIMTATGGLGMLGVLMFGMAFGTEHSAVVPVLSTGLITPLLLLAYLAMLILQGRLEGRSEDNDGETAGTNADGSGTTRLVRISASRFYAALAGLAAVIVLGGMWLSVLGNRMALSGDRGGFGLGESFIGTFFLAVSTSLPELVICVQSVRLGFLDMAAANVFGSNMFNLVIVFTADIGLRSGSILHYASPSHLITSAMVMILTSIAVVSLIYRSRRHLLGIGFGAWLMLVVYLAGNFMIYFQGK